MFFSHLFHSYPAASPVVGSSGRAREALGWASRESTLVQSEKTPDLQDHDGALPADCMGEMPRATKVACISLTASSMEMP